jgi:hypothetical protein
MAERHDDDGAEKASVNERDEEKERIIDRRDYLKFTGSATVAAGLAAGGASAAVTRHGISFDRVVDAVDDLGMDPSGGEAIDGKLSNVEPNTLVEFPNGEYKINGGFWFREDDASYGMVGVGDDVRIKPPNGTNDYLIHAFCGEFLFENIDVDIRADDTVGGFRIYPHQGFHVQDVEWLGRGWNGDFDQSGTVHAYMAGVQSSGGVGIFRNVVHKKISLLGDAYPSGGADRRGRAGIWAGGNHKGIIRLENCDFREARNNGLYMSRTPGYVQIENCYFENNNVSSIRISGEKSYVKNTKVVCDASRFSDTGDLSRDGINIRGLICEQKRFWSKPGPLTVEDTVFEWRSLPPGVNSGGVVNLGPAGRTLRLNNVDVKVDTNNTIALKRRSPNDLGYTPDKPWWIRADNLTITGSGSAGRSCCGRPTGRGSATAASASPDRTGTASSSGARTAASSRTRPSTSRGRRSP